MIITLELGVWLMRNKVVCSLISVFFLLIMITSVSALIDPEKRNYYVQDSNIYGVNGFTGNLDFSYILPDGRSLSYSSNYANRSQLFGAGFDLGGYINKIDVESYSSTDYNLVMPGGEVFRLMYNETEDKFVTIPYIPLNISFQGSKWTLLWDGTEFVFNPADKINGETWKWNIDTLIDKYGTEYGYSYFTDGEYTIPSMPGYTFESFYPLYFWKNGELIAEYAFSDRNDESIYGNKKVESITSYYPESGLEELSFDFEYQYLDNVLNMNSITMSFSDNPLTLETSFEYYDNGIIDKVTNPYKGTIDYVYDSDLKITDFTLDDGFDTIEYLLSYGNPIFIDDFVGYDSITLTLPDNYGTSTYHFLDDVIDPMTLFGLIEFIETNGDSYTNSSITWSSETIIGSVFSKVDSVESYSDGITTRIEYNNYNPEYGPLETISYGNMAVSDDDFTMVIDPYENSDLQARNIFVIEDVRTYAGIGTSGTLIERVDYENIDTTTGDPARIVPWCGSSCLGIDPAMDITYSDFGLVETYTDSTGFTTTLNRNLQDELTSVQNLGFSELTVNRDFNGEITKIITPELAVDYQSDALGLFEKMAFAGKSLQDPSIETEFELLPNGGYKFTTQEVLDSDSKSTTVTFYGGFGKLKETCMKHDSDAYCFAVEHNAIGLPSKEYEVFKAPWTGDYIVPQGNSVDYEYYKEPQAKVKKVTGLNNKETNYVYGSNSEGVYIEKEYDGIYNKITYDIYGREIRNQKMGYKQYSNIIYSSNLKTEYSYNTYGDLVITNKLLGASDYLTTSIFIFNPLGVLKEREIYETGNTYYNYHPDGNLYQKMGEQYITNYLYNADKSLDRKYSADFDNYYTRYQGRLYGIDGEDHTTSFYYDEYGRLEKETTCYTFEDNEVECRDVLADYDPGSLQPVSTTDSTGRKIDIELGEGFTEQIDDTAGHSYALDYDGINSLEIQENGQDYAYLKGDPSQDMFYDIREEAIYYESKNQLESNAFLRGSHGFLNVNMNLPNKIVESKDGNFFGMGNIKSTTLLNERFEPDMITVSECDASFTDCVAIGTQNIDYVAPVEYPYTPSTCSVEDDGVFQYTYSVLGLLVIKEEISTGNYFEFRYNSEGQVTEVDYVYTEGQTSYTQEVVRITYNALGQKIRAKVYSSGYDSASLDTYKYDYDFTGDIVSTELIRSEPAPVVPLPEPSNTYGLEEYDSYQSPVIEPQMNTNIPIYNPGEEVLDSFITDSDGCVIPDDDSFFGEYSVARGALEGFMEGLFHPLETANEIGGWVKYATWTSAGIGGTAIIFLGGYVAMPAFAAAGTSSTTAAGIGYAGLGMGVCGSISSQGFRIWENINKEMFNIPEWQTDLAALVGLTAPNALHRAVRGVSTAISRMRTPLPTRSTDGAVKISNIQRGRSHRQWTRAANRMGNPSNTRWYQANLEVAPGQNHVNGITMPMKNGENIIYINSHIKLYSPVDGLPSTFTKLQPGSAGVKCLMYEEIHHACYINFCKDNYLTQKVFLEEVAARVYLNKNFQKLGISKAMKAVYDFNSPIWLYFK
jgi:hypothetical protein